MIANNRRGGRPATRDLATPLLALLSLGPLKASEIANALGATTKCVTANLSRLKARGQVRIADGDEYESSKPWVLGATSIGFALGECWPVPIAFPPLPVPGTETTHERIAE